MGSSRVISNDRLLLFDRAALAARVVALLAVLSMVVDAVLALAMVVVVVTLLDEFV